MRVCLLTNSVSPHQLPFASRLAGQLERCAFLYVACGSKAPERDAMGWGSAEQPDWLVNLNALPERASEVRKRMAEADVLVSSNRDLSLFDVRRKERRHTLYMSERWYKPPLGKVRLFFPPYFRMAWKLRRLSRSPYFHYLAIGQKAAEDMVFSGMFGDRIYRWGYFVEPGDRSREGGGPQKTLRILWVGRMLALKGVDSLVEAAARLRERGHVFELRLVGQGPDEARIRRRVQTLQLGDAVIFSPIMPNAQIRQFMRESDVFVFPSNGVEGWGVVVNEAMLEGCAVVASRQAGAATTLIKDGFNGLLFDAGCVGELTFRLDKLASDKPFRSALAQAGRKTMLQHWTPAVAAECFLTMCDTLLSGTPFEGFSNGPLSKVRDTGEGVPK